MCATVVAEELERGRVLPANQPLAIDHVHRQSDLRQRNRDIPREMSKLSRERLPQLGRKLGRKTLALQL
jgi:hypothetical protein